ncbi:hypothetical protein ACFV1L_22915 [Kitasatospora sp. NPDC059646]|uniref:hypothetical protein n=1 Tax=Kitasatospora sp. NPDC059646 TaxID=3346893 RepID=UPI0036B46FCE
MKTAARGTLLVTAPLFAAAPMMVDASARFEAVVPTTDATCVLHAHRPLAPGTAHQPDTLTTTGTVTCVDAAGAPGPAGTFERTAPRPADRCTGEEYGDTTTVRWSDGTASTLRADRPAGSDTVRVNGTASLVLNGHVAEDSSRFPADTVHGVGTSTAAGCGTPAGPTAVDSTLVLRFTH